VVKTSGLVGFPIGYHIVLGMVGSGSGGTRAVAIRYFCRDAGSLLVVRLVGAYLKPIIDWLDRG